MKCMAVLFASSFYQDGSDFAGGTIAAVRASKFYGSLELVSIEQVIPEAEGSFNGQCQS